MIDLGITDIEDLYEYIADDTNEIRNELRYRYFQHMMELRMNDDKLPFKTRSLSAEEYCKFYIWAIYHGDRGNLQRGLKRAEIHLAMTRFMGIDHDETQDITGYMDKTLGYDPHGSYNESFAIIEFGGKLFDKLKKYKSSL